MAGKNEKLYNKNTGHDQPVTSSDKQAGERGKDWEKKVLAII